MYPHTIEYGAGERLTFLRRVPGPGGMMDTPAAVQRFAFPVLVVLGTLLGRYRKYANAPESVRRGPPPR